MVITGRVENGVVVLPAGTTLPEGAEVAVSYPVPAAAGHGEKQRIQLPLVRSEHPGSLNLSNERIAEILEEEDLQHHKRRLEMIDRIAALPIEGSTEPFSGADHDKVLYGKP